MLGMWRIEQWRSNRRFKAVLKAASQAVAQFPINMERHPHGLDAPLIVTLTSYPARFPTLALTLRSLLDQTVQVDKTLLWIAHADMSLLPEDVIKLQEYGLEIRECADIRSYKKLIPSLKMFSNAYLITADDDVYYDKDWLKSFVDCVNTEKRNVISFRSHMAFLDADGFFMPYEQWHYETAATADEGPRAVIFPTGVGGILYPPNSFGDEVFDEESFMSICPHGDDIWFFWMAKRHGKTHSNIGLKFEQIPWPRTQDTALWNENMLNGRNDAQIKGMEARYGVLPTFAS
ncbi:glycosyltransferase [Sphingobium chlorophenolicum L-1]|uniref:Glycosyltransferase n=1 Tax=Sphingobium chlorophenolicum L-1 TaxID=690566 RepID=F6EVA8_SPHCR|nr:hypothetical protein [Sphingobium chlorophenolicum]AEG49669.1 glycosyltransferase [Sphingobium chlorophenolicum L-1]